MEYVASPKEVSIKTIAKSGFSLTASKYKRIVNNSPRQKTLRDLLDRKLDNSSDKGIEVGTVNYIKTSPYKFIRTKSLQPTSFIPDVDNESILSVLPTAFKDFKLREGDVLISKDSNIGETAILDRGYPHCMVSGGIYKLPISKWKYYFLAFAKSGYFKAELEFLASRGATIRHAKTLFLDCIIPLPNQSNDKEVIAYVEQLVKASIDKEKEIRKRHQEIISLIDKELRNNQKPNQFVFKSPSIQEVIGGNRMDAGFYGEEFQEIMFLLTNYTGGYGMLDQQGLELIPGPSLEIKLLGTRVDSTTEREGFYRIVTPKQITNFGTVTAYEYMGTPRKIPTLQKGDIVFGESGTGRSFVYLSEHTNTITNAHGHVLRRRECTLEKAITIRCILAYLKESGFIDLITVGGAGGHLSPSYFNRVAIPQFGDEIQRELSRLYHNDVDRSYLDTASSDSLLEEDASWNKIAGIVELDDSIKKISAELKRIIDAIISNTPVNVDYTRLK